MSRFDATWGNFWHRGQVWYHFWQDGGPTALVPVIVGGHGPPAWWPSLSQGKRVVEELEDDEWLMWWD